MALLSKLSSATMRLTDTQRSLATKYKIFPKIIFSQKLKKKLAAKRKEKLNFTCETCEKKFVTWWEIRDHWQSTGHKSPEECHWCRKKTYTLQSHLCKQHLNVSNMCPYCGQLFMFKEDLARHKLNHDNKEFRCFYCGRRRKSEELLRNHVNNHYVKENYGCNICEKRFKKRKNLAKHVKQVHFVCPYCGNNCDSMKDLKIHIKTHVDLKCVHCQKVFSQKNRLKYHYEIIHGNQDFYKCSICFQRFPTKSKLIDHIKLKHKGAANFSCQVCAAPFLYYQQYVNHCMIAHNNTLPYNKTFNCSFCDFKTDKKVKLRWHVEKSSGFGFFCKKCQLRLECKGLFDKHMKLHKEECVWKCDHCPRSYTSDNTLNHHISRCHVEVKMRLNPKGYPCLERDCNKYYVVKSSLYRHLRNAHSISIKYRTRHTICQTPKLNKMIKNKGKLKQRETKKDSFQSLPSSNNIYYHMDNKSQTEVNAYFCDICAKCWFTGEIQFEKHMSTHKKKHWKEVQCRNCNLSLESPEETVRHYVEDHFQVKFVQ